MKTKTTLNLRWGAREALRAFAADHAVTLAIAALLLAFALGAGWGRQTAGAVVLVERATPTLAPLPTVGAIPAAAAADDRLRLARAIICYAAPHGDPLGAVDAGRAYLVEARSGAAWLLARIEGAGGFDGAGGCWVRADDLTGAHHAPDLATPTPTPAPRIEYVAVSAPAAPAPPAPTLRPETAATVRAIWDAGPGAGAASHLPAGVDPLAGCVDGCRVFVTPAP